MGSLSGGNGSLWGMGFFHSQEWNFERRRRRSSGEKEGKSSSNASKSSRADVNGGSGYRFPLKQAMTASSLALTGDTLAQLRDRWLKNKDTLPNPPHPKDMIGALLSEHDWLRSIRMASYGFLLYGPGTYAWYSYLDRCMPKQTVENILMKVVLNQIVLGPAVIAVIFAWNNLWLGKLSDLPNKYQKDALPTLLFGFRFWIPVSVLNFWVIPLQARVAFMSMASIFWNFWLSATMSK
ncbi:protein sym-1 isoform X2 [Nicotiana tomentosiformis]|uniref:protein sym-1 isoform X2 n=1 Tax=Nicotiana tomentosiformis TaxID=4098 RepID=UPI00051C7E63|nr:protein sym-1 isoform X2 [Nicotiana tomentosiformis]XP_033515422.1 protein sym-1 isoform X2 [Nicotiana tomentosiformis]